MEKFRYRLVSPVLMWAIIVVGGVILWFLVPKDRLFYSGMLGVVVLILGVVNWLYVGRAATSVHRQVARSVEGIDKLITEGIYAVVRHPIYAADIVLFWCAFIFFPALNVLGIVIWATVVFLFWANFEDRMLEEKFLDDYRAYKQRVPMIIPGLGGKK